MNLRRRHLTPSQRAAIAAESLNLYEAEAKERQRQQAKINQPQSQNKEKIPDSEKCQARDKAAAAANVNPRYVSDAKAIKEKAPTEAGAVSGKAD